MHAYDRTITSFAIMLEVTLISNDEEVITGVESPEVALDVVVTPYNVLPAVVTGCHN